MVIRGRVADFRHACYLPLRPRWLLPAGLFLGGEQLVERPVPRLGHVWGAAAVRFPPLAVGHFDASRVCCNQAAVNPFEQDCGIPAPVGSISFEPRNDVVDAATTSGIQDALLGRAYLAFPRATGARAATAVRT